MMRIAVLGAGAVGSYLGGRLAQAGNDVTLVARGAHLAALQSGGLQVHSPDGDAHVRLPSTDDPSTIEPCDLILVCVKATDNAAVGQLVKPLLKPGTAVVSLQNGIENEEQLADQIGGSHVVGGAAYMFVSRPGAGAVDHRGRTARIVIGELDGSRTTRVTQFAAACADANINAEVTDDIRTELWKKFAFVCATSGLTAAIRLPIGDIRSAPAAWDLFGRLLQEAHALASASGARLAPDILEQQLAAAMGLDPGLYSSLYDDLTNSRPMELDALHGAAIRIGKRCAIPTPACEAIFGVLQPWALSNARPARGE